MRALIATLTVLVLFAATPVAAGDFWDGRVAAQAGDYQKAYRLWKRSAEKGSVRAEFNLGRMYYEGKGVPQDYMPAYAWFSAAAEQGDAKGKELKKLSPRP